MNNRFKILLARYAEKKSGSINSDLMTVLNAYWSVERIKQELRIAEEQLKHSIRGLEHEDYNSIFEGWNNART